MAESVDEQKMPMLDHLVELRRRLIYSLLAFLVCFVVAFYFAAPIFNFLVAPLAAMWEGQEARRMIFTALHEKFLTEIRVAFFVGAFVAFPVIAIQLWRFIAPGLYRHEKRAFLPFLVATPVLFFMGGAFVYYVVLPVAWEFFASFEEPGVGENLAVVLEPKVDEYLSLVMRLVFAFGLSFELPVVISLLARVGLVSTETLRAKRRYAIVVAFIAAAILTPPDPISQLGLAIPIMLLYEISIWCARLIEKDRQAQAAKEEAGIAD